jgi:hypothetical protein
VVGFGWMDSILDDWYFCGGKAGLGECSLVEKKPVVLTLAF